MVTVVPGALDGFESGPGDWSADNGVWQIGTPTSGPGSCYSGTQCAGTVLAGNYPQGMDSSLISGPVVLPTVSGDEQVHLRFWEWFSYYNGGADNGQIKVSADGGSSWNDVGLAIENGSGGWTRRDVDLSTYAGQTVLSNIFRYLHRRSFE